MEFFNVLAHYGLRINELRITHYVLRISTYYLLFTVGLVVLAILQKRMKQNLFKISVRNCVRGLLLMRYPQIRSVVREIVQNFWNGYYTQEFAPVAVLYDVTLPIDARIPFRPRMVWVYMGFLFPLLAVCGHAFAKRGPHALPYIEKLLRGFGSLYADAGYVYGKAQTTFVRTGGDRVVSVLRLLDKERNSAPSLHVAVALYTYSAGLTLFQALELTDVVHARGVLERVAVRIIESTLLIKQHCVQDVAAAWVLVDMQKVSVSEDMARIVQSLFVRKRYGVSVDDVSQVHTEILRVHGLVHASPVQTLESIVSYILTLPHKNM